VKVLTAHLQDLRLGLAGLCEDNLFGILRDDCQLLLDHGDLCHAAGDNVLLNDNVLNTAEVVDAIEIVKTMEGCETAEAVEGEGTAGFDLRDGGGGEIKGTTLHDHGQTGADVSVAAS
jgi:hypothetical protein